MDLFTTIGLAAVDAINPCAIAIQAALLSMLLTKSRRNALIGGLLFSITVILMYALYGLVLHKILSMFYSIVKTLLFALLVILITLQFYAYLSYKPGIVLIEMPMFLRPYAHRLIAKVYSPWMAVPVAVLISLFISNISKTPKHTTLYIFYNILLTILLPVLYNNFSNLFLNETRKSNGMEKQIH